MKKLINKLLIAMIIIPILLGMGCSVFAANDYIGNTGIFNPWTGEEITVSGVYYISHTFTRYTLTAYNEDGTKNSWSGDLDKLDTITGTNIKGYAWYDIEKDRPYLAPENSQIKIDRAAVVKYLNREGKTALAAKVEDTTSRVELIMEPVLEIRVTAQGGNKRVGYYTVLEAFKFVENIKKNQNLKSNYHLGMAEPLNGTTGLGDGSLICLYGEYNSSAGVPLRDVLSNCFEEDPESYTTQYGDLYEVFTRGIISSRLANDADVLAGYGWAGYTFKAEIPPPPPTEIITNPEKSLTYVKIDNDQFNVYDSQNNQCGNPIPTEEELYIKGKSNLYGFVDGIKVIKQYVGNKKFTGKISVEYPVINNGNFEYRTKTVNYNNSTISDEKYKWVTAIDASESKFEEDFEFIIENPVFGEGDSKKQVFKSSDLGLGTPKYSKGLYSGPITDETRFMKKPNSVSEHINMDDRDKAVLGELWRLKQESGSSVANKRFENKLDEIQTKMNDILYSPNHFYGIKGDTPTITINRTKYNITANGAVIGNLYGIEKNKLDILENAENKSIEGQSGYTCYATSSGIYVGTVEKETNIAAPDYGSVNHVRVHTPISNKTTVTGGTPVDGSENAITVKPGDKVTVTLELNDDSVYYKEINNFKIEKYIKEYKIECGICEKTIDDVKHSCTIKANAKNGDNYTTKTIVIAKNIGTKAPATCAGNGDTNKPDKEYALIKTISIGVGTPPPTPETPTPTPTTTSTPTPTPTPAITTYKFNKLSDPVCNKPVDSELILDNDQFKVYPEGHSIPTSEYLDISGKTNLLGKIKGIQEWSVELPGGTCTAKAYYHTGTWKFSYQTWVITDKISGGSSSIDVSGSYEDVWDTYNRLKEQDKNEEGKEEPEHGDIYTLNSPYEIIGEEPMTKTYSPSIVTFKYTAEATAGAVNSIRTDSGSLIDGAKLDLQNVSVEYKPNNTTIPAASDDRITKNSTTYWLSRTYDDRTDAINALSADSPTASMFYTVKSDSGNVYVNGVLHESNIDNNCPITGDYRTFEKQDNQIKIVPNNTSLGYGSTAEHIIQYPDGTSDTIYDFNGNNVKVHTPIYNELIIDSLESNQLGTESLRAGNKIVTLDKEVRIAVRVEPKGSNKSWKYNDIANVNYSKYVKKVILNCPFCANIIEWNEYNGAGSQDSFEHICVAYPEKVDDNVNYPITSEVIAENGSTIDIVQKYNDTDTEYSAKQLRHAYVAGKIYDFKVRTTDDPAWKLANAQTLAQLPIGERGDNSITAYKNGIKLGYRAYFDLKTLGSATTRVNLTPQIYYINGNTVYDDTQFKLFYRDSSSRTSYKELKTQDIVINMTMESTRGAVNNADYSAELSRTLKNLNTTLNLKKKIGLEGLIGPISLTADNVFQTKYNGAYMDSKPSASRRWFGEIYLPASTVVTSNSGDVADIINNTNKVYKAGYLVITFEPIEAMVGNTSYLRYDYSKDCNWNNISEKSVLLEEKGTKSTIDLPGTVTVNVPNNYTSAPVIVYDVSLRANNDFESTGTH